MLCLDNIELLRKFVLCQDFSTKVRFALIYIYINALLKTLAKFFKNLLRKYLSYIKNIEHYMLCL